MGLIETLGHVGARASFKHSVAGLQAAPQAPSVGPSDPERMLWRPLPVSPAVTEDNRVGMQP